MVIFDRKVGYGFWEHSIGNGDIKTKNMDSRSKKLETRSLKLGEV